VTAISDESTDNRPPDPAKKPYTPPRLVRYGHVTDIVGGSMGRMSDGMPGDTKGCWIAEALYGVDDPRTILLRAWVTEVHEQRRRGWWLAALYIRFGRTAANLIRRSRLLRRLFLPVFDGLLARAGTAWVGKLPNRGLAMR
jgi:hypothetical protein